MSTVTVEEIGKATPAPWYVGAQNDQLYVTAGTPPAINNDYPNHEANRTPVAKVYTGPDDARLIAAAPELLAACKALMPEGWDAGHMDHMPGIQLAREAIAKAEGRS